MQLVLYIRNQQLLNLSFHPVELICLAILALLFVWMEARPPHESFPGWPRKLGRHERNVDVLAAWTNRNRQTKAQPQVNPADPTLSSSNLKSNDPSRSSQKNERGEDDQARQKTTKDHTDQAPSKNYPPWGFTTWALNDTGFEDSTNPQDSTASDTTTWGLSDSDDSVEDGVPLFPCKGNTEMERGRPAQRSHSSSVV